MKISAAVARSYKIKTKKQPFYNHSCFQNPFDFQLSEQKNP